MPKNKEQWINKHGLPASAMRIKSRVTTVNDLLARDDINGILKDLDKVKPHITDCIVIYVDKRDNKIHWNNTEDTLTSLAVYMLESVKLRLMNPGED